MDAALRQVESLKQKLTKFEVNFKKCSTANRTEGYLEGRLKGIEEIWGNICKVDDVMLSLQTDANADESYYEDDQFSDFEEKYYFLVGQIKDQLKVFKPTPTVNTGHTSNSNSNGGNQRQNDQTNNESKVKLPKINLPTFSGSYHTWMSFKNRFSNLIHENKILSNVEKLEYLKSCLTGEAERTIQRFQITEQNYTIAWDRLNEKYDNQRILQDTQIETIIDRRSIEVESAKELRDLLDIIQECLESLNNLKVDTKGWDPMLVVLLRRKLPFKTREEWEKELDPKDVPTYKQLIDFLEKRYRTVESLELVGEPTTNRHNKQSSFQRNQSKQQMSSNNSGHYGSQKTCIACNNERHSLIVCETFLNMSLSNRSAFVNAKKLCRNCLAVNHMITECKSSKTCFKCNRKHHTLLHRDEVVQNPAREPTYANRSQSFRCQSLRNSNSFQSERGQGQTFVNRGNQASQPSQPARESARQNPTNSEPSQVRTSLATTTLEGEETISQEGIKSIQRETLFPTAIISVKSEAGIVYNLRALLDQCSDDEAFIKESTAKMLGLKQIEIPAIEVAGLDEVITARINKATQFEMIIDKKESIHVEASIVKNLVGMLPKTEIKWPKDLFRNLTLADPNFATPNNVDVMLGGKIYADIILDGVLKGEGYLAQNTKLGWIISGKRSQLGSHQKSTCLHTRIIASPKKIVKTDEILKKFWEMEETPRKLKKHTEEEKLCEELFKQSYRRLNDGRVQVKLPFKEEPSEVLGESRSQAVARWLAMERKLEKNQQLKQDYMTAIQEHLDLGHMENVKTSEREHKLVKKDEKSTLSCYYIPHHAVVREESKTTKQGLYSMHQPRLQRKNH